MKRARFFIAATALAISASSLGVEFVVPDQGQIAFSTVGQTAVVDIRGPLLSHSDWMWDSYDAIRARVEAALASPCTSLALRIDSPGGEVSGMIELSRYIRSKAAACGKRVVAYVDGMAASAAYALACAADTIVIPPSGIAGSIGCIKVAVDQTAMHAQMGLAFAVVTSGARKADGNPITPITEASVAAFQREVDESASLFFELVSEARSLSVESVVALEAATFLGASAVAAGLADKVGCFEELIAMAAVANGAEVTMTEREKAIAALKAMAAGDNEEDKNYAVAALKAIGEGEDEEKKEDPKPEAKAAKAEEPEAAPEPKKEEKTDAVLASVTALTVRVDSEEKSRLLATRSDLDSATLEYLGRQPVEAVRDAVKSLPRGVAKSPVAAARAAIGATGTRGDFGDRPSPSEANDLDVRMGLAKRTSAIRTEGTRQIIGVMTPDEARAELAKRNASQNGASK